MANIFEFDGFVPVIHRGAYIHENATIIGNVVIKDRVYIGPGACLRGDIGKILIEEGCNVQDNCIIHMFPGVTVTLHRNAHIGHGAIIHGASVGENCLIGMNAVIMDDAYIGKESVVGALCFVKPNHQVPPRSVIVGNPGKVIKQVSDDMLNWKTKGTELYQDLAKESIASLKPCEPLREETSEDREFKTQYKSWNRK